MRGVSDCRISVGLPGHPKTVKLIRRVGREGAWSLVCLIAFASANRPDGDLSSMSVEDIEIAADWHGAEGKLVEVLREVGFLDSDSDGLRLHDWAEHNPWAMGADRRSEQAREAAIARHTRRRRAVPAEPPKVQTACTQNAVGIQTACGEHADSTKQQCPVSVSVSDTVSKPLTEPEQLPLAGGSSAERAATYDPVKFIFDTGVQLLVAALVPDQSARSFLGKLRGTYGNEVVEQAIRDAQAQNPPVSDPRAWLTAACTAKSKHRKAVDIGQQDYSAGWGEQAA